MKIYENFQFLEVKFSIYLYRRVNVMLFIRWILQDDVFITNKSYIYVAIWTILFTFYHDECMFLENGVG